MAHIDALPHPAWPLLPALAAKLWCDLESAEEAEELSRLYGSTLVPAFTGTAGGCMVTASCCHGVR